MDGVSVGIDLGSEIKVAWFNPIKGIVTQIKNAEGQLTTPAIVSLAGDLKIGELAAGALTDSPKRPFVFYWQHHQISQPGIVATPTGNYRFSDILLLIFKKIRQDIEFYFFNTALIHVTLAYPSFYDSLQRHFLMEAVKNAGFGSVSLLPAAIATAVAFEKKELQLDNFILICDFGAQSCRLTILNRIQKDLAFEIWGESDNFPFGGNQVDWLLYQYVEERIFSEIDEPNSPKELDGDLFRECRTAKEILSSGKDSKQIRSLFKQKLSVTHFKKFESIKQSDFKNLIQESLHAVVNNIGKFIDNAESKSTNKVTQILLTGGSAHLLGLKEILKKNFQERINFFQLDEPQNTNVVGCVYQSENLRPANKREIPRLTKNETRASLTSPGRGPEFVLVDGTKTSTGIWDIYRTQLRYILDVPYFARTIGSIAINKQENLIVTGGTDNIIRMWHVETGSLLRTFYGHFAAISFLFIDQTHQIIVSNSYDETLKIWNMMNGEMLLSIPYCTGISSVAIDSDGKYLAGLNSRTNKLRIWDLAEGDLIEKIESVSILNKFSGLEFNDTGNELLILRDSEKIKVWQIPNY